MIAPQGFNDHPGFSESPVIRRTAPLAIIEGPDACGKTTFAKFMAKVTGAVYWHLTCSDLLAPAMKDYQFNALDNVQANLDLGRPTVLDRHWPSEHCYGMHFRPGTMVNVEAIRIHTANFRPLIIFCMDPNGAEAAADRHEKHLDMAHPYKREDYIAVYRNYEQLIAILAERGEMIAIRDFQPERNLTSDSCFIKEVLTAYDKHSH